MADGLQNRRIGRSFGDERGEDPQPQPATAGARRSLPQVAMNGGQPGAGELPVLIVIGMLEV